MNIIDLDIEIILKAKEILKIILKKPSVLISFDVVNEEVSDDMLMVKYKNHMFLLYKEEQNFDKIELNIKYQKYFTHKMLKKLENLSVEEKIKLIRKKYWYLFILNPFLGKLMRKKKDTNIIYILNYNSVIINIEKNDYEKFVYYISYVYKLNQLNNLNKELNINQTFQIIFDDDKPISDLYKNISDNFKNIINNPLKNINDLDDLDEDDGDLDDDFDDDFLDD